MPAWLITILTGLLKSLITTTLKDIWDGIQDSKELRDWKNVEKAKLDLAAEKYKEDLKKAGDDEQAQKDAFDKLTSGPK